MTLRANTVVGNRQGAVVGMAPGGTLTVSDNTLTGNAEYNLANWWRAPVDASHNWWGRPTHS
jgi:hypothetical protein